MSPPRRAGAPRLIEWTGERCVPWTPDVPVAYEHFHRYMWAAELVAGRRVLDLGSGEGFGSAILGERAAAVSGIDIDALTVEHAELNWSAPTVSFQMASAVDLSVFPDASFDAVVAFEIIEHLEQQERVLEEIARVLTEDGLLVMSTPDRRMYSIGSARENPFHRRELTESEFRELLGGCFEYVELWGQRTISGSHLGRLGSPSAEGGGRDFFIERAGDEWRSASPPDGIYLVALASRAPLPPAPDLSTAGDCGLELLRTVERESSERATAMAAANEEAILHERSAAVAAAERLAQLQEELVARGAELAARDAQLAERDTYMRHRASEIATLRGRLAAGEAAAVAGAAQLEQANLATQQMRESVTWQLFERARGRVIAGLGESSIAIRAMKLLLRRGGRVLSRQHRAPSEPAAEVAPDLPAGGEPIVFPAFENPTATLVIPVYSQPALTRRTLETIRDNTDEVSYEVVIVDDCADAETKALLEVVEGARVISNEENIGYIRSVNRGAGEAQGRWLVLCNNDIEVATEWLSSLTACGEAHASAAIVAPQFLAPDRSLSEAGGIIWRDATGVNYGRGADSHHYQFQFTRDVDYGSAAALLVRREVWVALDGFDERYAPMYYEDVDLCFRAREQGWRVLYEPNAMVVHAEGSTAGTDESSGHKRFQAINREKFRERWRSVLDAEHLAADPRRVRQAANRLRTDRVLVVDFRVPMWDRDAGSLRMFEILRALQRLGLSVTFLPDNQAALAPYTRELQRLGVEVVYSPADVNQLLADIGPGLRAAILSRPHSAAHWLDTVREVAPASTVIYDTVDLHWIRESRRFTLGRRDQPSAVSNGVALEPGAPLGPKARALLELELAMVRAADITLAVTDEEEAQICALVPGARTAVISTVHDPTPVVRPAASRRGLLFVGGFEHPPNVDAARFLVDEVMPLVWQRDGSVEVTIVGSSAPPELADLDRPRVAMRGWVQDLEPLLGAARALVVPIRFGAGIKGKVTQGLAAGLPVVTTPLGVEGICESDGGCVLTGESAEELAAQILRIVADDELWSSLSQRGQELVEARWSRRVLDARLRALIEPGPPPLAAAATRRLDR